MGLETPRVGSPWKRHALTVPLEAFVMHYKPPAKSRKLPVENDDFSDDNQ